MAVGQWPDDDPGAALSEATALVAGIVVDQRSGPVPSRAGVAELADAAVQHIAVLGELADVVENQVAATDPADALNAAALRAALSSAQLFASELAKRLSQPSEPAVERRSA